MEDVLTTIDLNVGYRSEGWTNVLFEGINLRLRAGELVCFMGPNGVGKSSLIRTLAGLQKPISGEVRWSKSSHKDPSRNISVVLTDKVSGGNLTAYDVVAFGRYPYMSWSLSRTADDDRLIDQSIDAVHINNLRDAPIHSLSDGQLQMVMIARALCQDTPIILLDEPTAHLDLNNRVEIMKMLRSLARRTQKAILVATHELDLALQLADHIWLAGQDKKIFSGFPEDLVLSGVFDDIFQFKGFDLKTGKVKHDAHTGKDVSVVGDGPELLWTKNALERSGFEIKSESNLHITVSSINRKTRWQLQHDTDRYAFNSLEDLTKKLLAIDCNTSA